MSSFGIGMEREMDQKSYIIHPQKFALWLFIVTVIMIFGGLTSAYVVHRGSLSEGEKLFFDLPPILWTNLIVIILSSLSMQFSLREVGRENNQRAMIGLLVTVALGIWFLLGQLQAFVDLTESNLFFVDQTRQDDSVSYFYVITGLHGLHIVAGLIVLLVCLLKTAFSSFRSGRQLISYEMTAIFWHFLGLLWVYLFIFMKYTQE
ncbi:MAG: cytochrome c oxidase subunit 3 [Bacteroidota bacterium]